VQVEEAIVVLADLPGLSESLHSVDTLAGRTAGVENSDECPLRVGRQLRNLVADTLLHRTSEKN
jgi:hypothetical protein